MSSTKVTPSLYRPPGERQNWHLWDKGAVPKSKLRRSKKAASLELNGIEFAELFFPGGKRWNVTEGWKP